jgi:2',3'-cyclic-nucleotide 2'-phosphodiesterase (5'-nucleotidase family)
MRPAKSLTAPLLLVVCALGVGVLASLAAATDEPGLTTLSFVGTTDLHGSVFPRNGIGGLPLFAGYVNNLRAIRALDGGAVLLIDSGDTFQGGIESDLTEGALVVDAYNAMAYTSETIGNHDFDFGSEDSPSARQLPGDLRGAIKARAAQARYPFLAANLIDVATGEPVAWPNVRRSVLVNAAGVRVGIVGVTTIDALESTIGANVQGLRVAPLGPAIVAEASKLREAGAEIVVVAAHAGGRCDRFDEADDLSSCDANSEIFRLATSLPRGLVDVILAGHTHAALAQQVAGVAIIQAFSHGQAFGRVDVVFDQKTRSVARTRIFPPRQICPEENSSNGNCATGAERGVPTQYEGKPVVADPAIVHAMAPSLERVRALQSTTLGPVLTAPISRASDAGSPLGDLFADAIREATFGADVAVLNNAARGLWADLPAGPLTFGSLYDVFPFDNRVVRLTLSGGELRRWLDGELRQNRLRSLGVSGVSLQVSCAADGPRVAILRPGGQAVSDEERLLVVTIGEPTLSGNVVLAGSADSAGATVDGPVVREVVEDWFRRAATHAGAQFPAPRSVRMAPSTCG